jgi:hypothetical protein
MLPRRTLSAGSVRRVTHDEIADTIGENVRGVQEHRFPDTDEEKGTTACRESEQKGKALEPEVSLSIGPLALRWYGLMDVVAMAISMKSWQTHIRLIVFPPGSSQECSTVSTLAASTSSHPSRVRT